MSAARVLVLACALTACGTARRGEPFVSERAIADPAVRTGQIVFAQKCYTCHPGGAEGLGPAINNKPLPGVAVKTQVRKGLGRMPSFPEDEISDERLDALVSYLSWLRDREPPAAATD